jgi:co-chaperonin GroES (HSP10)
MRPAPFQATRRGSPLETEVSAPIRPLRDLDLIERDNPDGLYGGIIIIPDKSIARSNKGTVVRCGPRATLLPGCRVAMSELHGIELKIDGVLYTLIQERDILGVIEDEQAKPL